MDQTKSLKQLRNDYKEHGVFYTDSKLAEIIKQFIPADVKEVFITGTDTASGVQITTMSGGGLMIW